MHGIFLYAAADSTVAALPFLPRGKGALILILGGMAVLVVSLLWSSLVPRSAGVRGRASSRAHAFFAPASAPPSRAPAMTPSQSVPPWIAGVIELANREGLGRAALIMDGEARPVLRLSNCRTCQRRGTALGCEHERVTLERLVRTFMASGRVLEVSCNADRRGTCTFELHTGARTP